MYRYFLWDYRVLKTFAKHYSTGEIIPKKLVESMQGARKMFAATELQRQVIVQGLSKSIPLDQFLLIEAKLQNHKEGILTHVYLLVFCSSDFLCCY